jgi:uncharacterized protein
VIVRTVLEVSLARLSGRATAGAAAEGHRPWAYHGRVSHRADAGEPPVTDEELRQLLLDTKVIAVVGLSANPDRPSNQVAWYLHHHGYRLFGVNPRCPEPEVFGVPMLPSLDQVPEPIDLVDVFRRPEHTADVARAAVATGAGALWLQLGIANPEARAIAEEADLRYVEDRCLKVEHGRLLG